jgi:hypothetical protein
MFRPLLARSLAFSVALLATPLTGAADLTRFGAAITADDAVPVARVIADPAAHAGKTVKLAGRTDGVCTKKGCWMTLKGPDQTASLRVTFRDYGFFVPKEILGRDVIVEGKVEIKEQSVDELRHLAEDAGRSPAEIAAIVAPVTNAALVADGVLVVADAKQ